MNNNSRRGISCTNIVNHTKRLSVGESPPKGAYSEHFLYLMKRRRPQPETFEEVDRHCRMCHCTRSNLNVTSISYPVMYNYIVQERFSALPRATLNIVLRFTAGTEYICAGARAGVT